MRYFIFLLFKFLIAIGCFGAGGYFIYENRPPAQWGWFLFFGFVAMMSIYYVPANKNSKKGVNKDGK